MIEICIDRHDICMNVVICTTEKPKFRDTSSKSQHYEQEGIYRCVAKDHQNLAQLSAFDCLN